VNGDRDDIEDGPINLLEVVSYASVVLFIAALATGWFDLMLPWG
jgi:hypothetical protein